MMPATSSGFWAIGLPSAAPSSAGLSMVNASQWSTNINRWCFRYIHRFVSSHRWLFDPSTFRCHMEISRKYPKIASRSLGVDTAAWAQQRFWPWVRAKFVSTPHFIHFGWSPNDLASTKRSAFRSSSARSSTTLRIRRPEIVEGTAPRGVKQPIHKW